MQDQPVMLNPNLFYINTRCWGINELDKKPMRMYREKTVSKLNFWLNVLQFWRFRKRGNLLTEKEYFADSRLTAFMRYYFFMGFVHAFFNMRVQGDFYKDNRVAKYFSTQGYLTGLIEN